MINILRYHLIIDFKDIEFPDNREEQEAHLNSWLDTILQAIDMRILKGPYFAYGEVSEKGAQEGWSMTSIIDFSSINIHHFKQSNEIKIDIFSCKPFDANRAEEVCKDYFGQSVKFKTLLVIG